MDGRRGPLIIDERLGWHCVLCQVGGDALALAGALGPARTHRPRGADFHATVAWLQERGLTRAEPIPIVERPPQRIDPTPALRQAVPLSSLSGDQELAEWLALRRIPPTAPAGWLPRFRAEWWPSAKHFPVVLPACTGAGKVESLHGLSVACRERRQRKTTWPRGAESRELLFAAAATRQWLSGQAPPPRLVILCEGATDYLTAAGLLGDQAAVLGFVSGSAGALRLVKLVLPPSATVIAIMDPDEQGERYEEQIVNALFPHPIRQTSLREIQGWI
jgi:hypothetical protein